jgi:K+-transporting ATPase KdpF subunit
MSSSRAERGILVKGLYAFCTAWTPECGRPRCRRQDPVKVRHGAVNGAGGRDPGALTGDVIENVIAAALGLALLAYLVYALIRPEKF